MERQLSQLHYSILDDGESMGGGSAENPEFALSTKLDTKLRFHPSAACVTDPVRILEREAA